MKKSLLVAASLVPMMSQAAPLMQVPAHCEQIESQSGKTKTSDYPATLELESRGDGTLVVKVQGPEAKYRGANMIATVKNVEVQRSLDGAAAMGTSLETIRLSNRITKYDKFTSVRMSRSQARLVSMYQYDDTGRWPKRSWKLVIECIPTAAIGSNDIENMVDAINADL